MDSAIDLVLKVLQSQPDLYPMSDDDYEQDGIMYCAKCHTPRQMWVDFPDKKHLVRVLCDCLAAKLDAEDEADRKRKHQEKLKLWRAQGVSDVKWHTCTFANDDGKDEKASAECRAYADHFKEMLDSDTGLMLYGEVGTGKTFLAACIANQLIDAGWYVLMVNLPSLIASMNADYGEKREYYMEKIARAHLLVLDDFGVERDTEYSIEQVYGVINARVQSGKPMIVTTNLTMQEFREEQGRGKKRIYDRVIEKCVPLLVKGESRRKAIAAEKREAAMRILKSE